MLPTSPFPHPSIEKRTIKLYILDTSFLFLTAVYLALHTLNDRYKCIYSIIPFSAYSIRKYWTLEQKEGHKANVCFQVNNFVLTLFQFFSLVQFVTIALKVDGFLDWNWT